MFPPYGFLFPLEESTVCRTLFTICPANMTHTGIANAKKFLFTRSLTSQALLKELQHITLRGGHTLFQEAATIRTSDALCLLVGGLFVHFEMLVGRSTHLLKRTEKFYLCFDEGADSLPARQISSIGSREARVNLKETERGREAKLTTLLPMEYILPSTTLMNPDKRNKLFSWT